MEDLLNILSGKKKKSPVRELNTKVNNIVSDIMGTSNGSKKKMYGYIPDIQGSPMKQRPILPPRKGKDPLASFMTPMKIKTDKIIKHNDLKVNTNWAGSKKDYNVHANYLMNGSKKNNSANHLMNGPKKKSSPMTKQNFQDLVNPKTVGMFRGKHNPKVGEMISPKQQKFLKQTRMGSKRSHERFTDHDGDGVISGLDCNALNPNEHGFWSKTGHWLKGDGFRETEDIERSRELVQQQEKVYQEDVQRLNEAKQRAIEQQQKQQDLDEYLKKRAELAEQQSKIGEKRESLGDNVDSYKAALETTGEWHKQYAKEKTAEEIKKGITVDEVQSREIEQPKPIIEESKETTRYPIFRGVENWRPIDNRQFKQLEAGEKELVGKQLEDYWLAKSRNVLFEKGKTIPTDYEKYLKSTKENVFLKEQQKSQQEKERAEKEKQQAEDRLIKTAQTLDKQQTELRKSQREGSIKETVDSVKDVIGSAKKVPSNVGTWVKERPWEAFKEAAVERGFFKVDGKIKTPEGELKNRRVFDPFAGLKMMTGFATESKEQRADMKVELKDNKLRRDIDVIGIDRYTTITNKMKFKAGKTGSPLQLWEIQRAVAIEADKKRRERAKALEKEQFERPLVYAEREQRLKYAGLQSAMSDVNLMKTAMQADQQRKIMEQMYGKPKDPLSDFMYSSKPRVEQSIDVIGPQGEVSVPSAYDDVPDLPVQKPYSLDAPKFVYKRKVGSFTRKTSRFGEQKDLAPGESSDPSNKVRGDSKYPWTKPMDGWERLYVGKGRSTGRGRSKRSKVPGDYITSKTISKEGLKRKFVPYVQTYGLPATKYKNPQSFKRSFMKV